MKREVHYHLTLFFILSFIFKGECLMNMTNNMNNFARFSNDEINIVAKAFSIIYAYSGEFDGGNNEEKFIKLTDAFDKLISEFRKSEISNFPTLKERTERGLNNKPEAYYDFWFVSFVRLISKEFNKHNEDKFGTLFNKMTTYLSITRNIPVDSKNAILNEILHNSDMTREEAILIELIIRLKPCVKELFDNNQDDQLLDYLGNAFPECIVKEKELIEPAIDSLAGKTRDSKINKIRIIEDAASMLILLAFVDDLIIRMTSKKDVAFAFNSSDEECLKEMERGKIVGSRAMKLILKIRTTIREFMNDQILNPEAKELFGEIFS